MRGRYRCRELADHWVLPRLAPLLARHPALHVELLTGAGVLNLARREADVAIRMVRPSQRELVARRLGDLKLALYAPRAATGSRRSASRANGVPSLPFVGLHEDATSEAESALRRRLEGAGLGAPSLRCGAWSSVLAALRAGLGMGILPSFMGDAEPTLGRVDGDSSRGALWLVAHPDILPSARVRALADFLVEQFRAPVFARE